MEIRIKDANGQTNLSIEIVDKEPNGEWAICMAHFSYDGFEAKFKFSTMLANFHTFIDELEVLYSTLKGQAKFHSMEDNVSFQLSTDGMGHIEISGYLRHKLYEVKTSFLIHSDQTFLPELLQECRQIK